MLQRKYFEHILTDHCNLKCENCSMHSPFLDEEFSELEVFKRDLDVMSKIMKVEKFRFIGGEPTLHPQLSEFIQAVKDSGMADSIAICTNGVNLWSWTDEMFRKVGHIDVSIYKETKIDYTQLFWFLRAKKKELDDCFTFTMTPFGFFMDMYSNEKLDDETVQKTYDECINKSTCHSFKNGMYYRCSITVTKNKFLKNIGKEVETNFLETDGLSIHEPDLEARLIEYIRSPKPLGACSYCHGTNAQIKTRKQQTVEEIKFYKNGIVA